MQALSKIPKVDKLLADPAFAAIRAQYPGKIVLKAVRTVLATIRAGILSGRAETGQLAIPEIASLVEAELLKESAFSLRRVVNGTGTVIHTNLGRSPLPGKILPQLLETAAAYSNLEFDSQTGERGDRYGHLEPLICELTGAEAAVAVNNNAAALLLALSSLARGREVIVSRGELVEIGGSFRIPEIMAQSGAILREVGTTNRTHLRDYQLALGPETGLLLKVSCSNFAMTGFTAEASAEQLAGLGREAGVPLLVDAGSGLMVDLSRVPGCHEKTVPEYIAAGADVVVSSGDKLLGGPQAGIIAGRRTLVEPMKKHPLLRALRLDKLTLCALEGVLRLHRDEREALREIPVLRMLTCTEEELKSRGGVIVRRFRRHSPPDVTLQLVGGFSLSGGGALPDLQLPTALIAISSTIHSAVEIERRFRTAAVPVIGRIARDRFLLDVRTLLDGDLPFVETALQSLAERR